MGAECAQLRKTVLPLYRLSKSNGSFCGQLLSEPWPTMRQIQPFDDSILVEWGENTETEGAHHGRRRISSASARIPHFCPPLNISVAGSVRFQIITRHNGLAHLGLPGSSRKPCLPRCQ